MYNFIVNPSAKSGKCKQIWQNIEKILIAKELPYCVHFTAHADEDIAKTAPAIAREIEAECISNKEECRIVLIGGDGTLNEMIQELSCPEKVTLGLIPAGSGNDFARALRIPTNPEEALQRILSCEEPHRIDIGEVTYHTYDETSLKVAPSQMKETRRFLISSGIGFDAATCELSMVSGKKEKLNKLHLGKLTYIVNALHLITHIEQVPATIWVNDANERHLSRMILTVGMNTCYEGGGFMFCPNANPSDGKIEICIAQDMTFRQVLGVLGKIPSGAHVNRPGISILRGDKIRIKTETPLWVHTDGEVVTKATDITMRCDQLHTYFLY